LSAGDGKRVVIVGMGRVGGLLARGLLATGWRVHATPGSRASNRHASRLKVPLAAPASLRAASACILAVPDGAVPEAAKHWAQRLPPETPLLHCAGALPLQALGKGKARPKGSFHPLCAISSSDDDIQGCAVALSASTPALLRTLKAMARSLKLSPIEVSEESRPLYHAGAVLAAGGVVALLSRAAALLARAGLSESEARAAVFPLAASALRRAQLRGFSKGLTGPVVRGDARTVKMHLEAMAAAEQPLYRLLSREALRLSQSSLDATSARQLEQLLGSLRG
jgi:predicted short-subunit dehydrogenase-like oxidoreductase (DUF2520 family)